MKNVWPQSTCVECGRLIPNGCQQYCTMIGAGFCTHHFPAAVEERYNEMYAALEALLECHSCDTGEVDYKAEWEGDHTVCDACKPAHTALRHAKGEL